MEPDATIKSGETMKVNEEIKPTGDGARSERQERDLELAPLSTLRDIQAWLSFRLEIGIRHKPGTIGPTYTDGYSYVEIPEWEARQKLDNARAALSLVDVQTDEGNK